jgi:hypothetical protein
MQTVYHTYNTSGNALQGGKLIQFETAKNQCAFPFFWKTIQKNGKPIVDGKRN